MAGPLEGTIRVLDLSRILAGPWTGQILADFGAEVIKVERPEGGDDTRHWGPPYVTDEAGNDTTESAYYMSANRGKKSITVDFTKPEGQAIIRRLAAKCDVLIENFKVGGLAKYGLDYDSLAADNPGLIYCSITGFGQTGPYRHRAGYDFMIQGMGGLMSLTGAPDGAPGGGPVKVGVALADVLTGLYAGNAILAALNHRQRSGRGQHIDMALLDVQVATLANQAMNYLTSGTAPTRLGNAHPNIVPYQAFATSDGHVILAVGNDAQFKRFCAVAGRADLSDLPEYASNAKRVHSRDVLVPIIEELMTGRTSADWLAALEKVGVPCGPINTLDQVFDDPQIIARNMRVDIPHPLAGSVPQVRNPIKFSDTPMTFDQAPPTLGQHTETALAELLDMGADELAKLKDKNIL